MRRKGSRAIEKKKNKSESESRSGFVFKNIKAHENLYRIGESNSYLKIENLLS